MEVSLTVSIDHRTAVGVADGTPFSSADEAWLWAMKGMKSHLDGANVKGESSDITKPCEASDVLICARSLHRGGQMTDGELRVVLLYGSYAVAPMKLGESHVAAVPFWNRGIDMLVSILEQKKIINKQGKGGSNEN